MKGAPQNQPHQKTPAVRNLAQHPLENETPLVIEAMQMARIFKALGHPARLQIVRHLLRIDECICGDIVQQLPLAQSTVSQHLKVLKQAGLIQGKLSGPKTCYCLNRRVWQQFLAAVRDLR
jgi:ArsR family transcriptional regulator